MEHFSEIGDVRLGLYTRFVPTLRACRIDLHTLSAVGIDRGEGVPHSQQLKERETPDEHPNWSVCTH